MGSAISKEDKMIDDGYSNTNGLYSNVVQDYDKKVVRKLITARKLAPFYKGLDQIDTPSEEKVSLNEPSSSAPTNKQSTNKKSLLYANAVECPICFLYYPSNINFSKCCDQPLCTECFVQIKRTDPHLPACCPFCVQPNFGIIYHLPSSVTHPERYSAMFDPSPSCHHIFTKNILHRSVSCYESPAPLSATVDQKLSTSSPLTLRQINSHTRRSLVKQKPSMIVLIDHIRQGFDDHIYPITSTTLATTDSSLPLRRYYATDTTMQAPPSFEDWMLMEAIRRSVQDQQSQQHMSDSPTSSSPPNANNSEAVVPPSLDQRTTGTTMTSDDSSTPC